MLSNFKGCPLLFMLVVLLGCSDVAPTNPYDPETPLAQQARASLTGQLVLPNGYDATLRFDGLSVSLASTTMSGDEPKRASVDSEGVFSFEDLGADVYQLSAVVSGFMPVSLLIEIQRGVDRRIPSVFLTPQALSEQAERQWVRGNVVLNGRSDNDQGGVLISVVGAP